MSKYIDADALLERLPDDLPYKGSVKRVLMQAPTADVVEVVRCKDCVYFEMDDDGICYCLNSTGFDSKDLDDFCSEGERREEQ